MNIPSTSPLCTSNNNESNDSFEQEHEVIHKISNYTYQHRHGSRRYNDWHHFHVWFNWRDSTKLLLSRRGSSILFVITVIVVSAAWIGVVIVPKEDVVTDEISSSSSTTTIPQTNINPKNTLSPNSKYTPMRSNNNNSNINHNNDNNHIMQNYQSTPQQLLELTEQINIACDESSIIHHDNRKICQQLCHEKMCCFQEEPYSCIDNEEMVCAVYMGCQVLYGDYISVTPSSSASKSNNNDNVPYTQLTTSKLLQLADEIFGYCDEYAMDPQSEMGRECVAHCQGHMCCFEDEGGWGNGCNDDGEDILCEVYEGCEVLIGTKEVGNVT